jgi:hypothetical protein
MDMQITPTTATSRFVGACEHCDRPIAIEDDSARYDYLRTPCPECTTSVKLERLYGTLVTDIACNSACQGAIGPVCECSCGGGNHSAGFVIGRGHDTLSNIAKFRATRAKKQATAAAKREAKAVAAKAATVTWNIENADVVSFLGAYQGDNDFLVSVSDQLSRKGQLSEKQTDAVRRFATRETERQVRIAAQRAADAVNGKPAPAGRVTVTGEVLSVKEQESDFGLVRKMLVRGDGFKVWVTVPEALSSAIAFERSETYETYSATVASLKGRTVTFTATLVPSEDDKFFAIGKRPASVKLHEEVVA